MTQELIPALYADADRRELQLQENDMVMLSTEHLKWSKEQPGTKKLMPKWVGPFKVIARVNPVAYRLELPGSMRVHNVFHVSLLKRFHSSDRHVPAPTPLLIEGEEEYEVHSILGHRLRSQGKAKKRKPRMHYSVQWSGYGPEHNSWEPIDCLEHSPDSINEYWQARQAAGLPGLQECMSQHPDAVTDPHTSAVHEQARPAKQRRKRKRQSAAVSAH